MNSRVTSCAICLMLMAAGLVSSAGQPAGQARDVVTEEQLLEHATSAPGLKTLLETRAKPVVEAAPSMQSSLWSRSIILTDGEMFTLVPIGSILHLPPALRDRVAAAPVGRFTFWPAFQKRNETWLAGHEVSLEMSRGDAKAARQVMQSIAKDSRLLVALYKGGPVTLLEKAPETAAEKK